MSNWAGGVLTAAGRALQAKVEAGATALVLTKIKLGDGTEGMDAVDNLTDLVGAKAVLGISSSVAEGDHATITGVMLSTQLQAGFWCREWGLFATDPDVGEILYMITIDAQPEWLPASTAAAQVSATYAMNIAVANATNIEVQIDPAGLVDVEMLDSYMGLAKRSTAVALGDTAMLEGIPAGYFLECTTSGTTGATAPVISSVTAGDTITDGSVVWTVRRAVCEADYPKTSFGTAVVNHLLGSTLASLVSAVSTDSLFSKLLKLALKAAGLRYSMGTNGYICFGALFGGLILQWGTVSTTLFTVVGNYSKYRKALPIELSSTPYLVYPSSANINSSTGIAIPVSTYCDKNNLDIFIADTNPGAYQVTWSVIGC